MTSTSTSFESTKLSLSQVFSILNILQENGPLSKEELYTEMGGSRQTKIRVVKEMIDHGLICVSSVEAHNKQYLVNTDYGLQFLSMEKASPFSNVKSEYRTESAPLSVTIRENDDDYIREFKMNLNSANALVDTKPIHFTLIYKALDSAKEALMAKQYDSKTYVLNDPSMLTGSANPAKNAALAEENMRREEKDESKRYVLNDPSMLTGSADSSENANPASKKDVQTQTIKH